MTGLAPGAPQHPGQAVRGAVSDVVVLTARNLVHIAREPLRLFGAVIQPVLFTLLFVYVFGGAINLPGSRSIIFGFFRLKAPGGTSYIDFVIAGMLVFNITTIAIGAAVGLSDDLSNGIIDRFRVLPIWKPAVLVGRSFTDLLAAVVCAAMIVATGLVVGWEPHTDIASVTAAFALCFLFSYALSWGCACIGLLSKDAESAQGVAMVVLVSLALVSNTMVPTQFMTPLLSTIANWNPVSAVTAACRQLLGNFNPSNTIDIWPMQHPVLASLLSSVAIIVVFAPLATLLYKRRAAD
jgi:ABC-type polysaccharide/polyol phosphate export permease